MSAQFSDDETVHSWGPEQDAQPRDVFSDDEDDKTLVGSDSDREISDISDDDDEDKALKVPMEILRSLCDARDETRGHAKHAIKEANQDIERAYRVIELAKQDIERSYRVIKQAKRNKEKARKTRRKNIKWIREEITTVESKIGEIRSAKEDRFYARNTKKAFAIALYRGA